MGDTECVGGTGFRNWQWYMYEYDHRERERENIEKDNERRDKRIEDRSKRETRTSGC